MGNATPNPGHELVLTRLIDAPKEKLFRCWTEPKLMKQCSPRCPGPSPTPRWTCAPAARA